MNALSKTGVNGLAILNVASTYGQAVSTAELKNDFYKQMRAKR